MTRTITTTLYQFDELSDDAKERARDWYRTDLELDHEYVYDDAQRIAEILGVTFATKSIPLMNGDTRQVPRIWWTGFSSQGDGASWEGSYAYAPKASRKIRAYAPTDSTLHEIADELQRAQRPNFYKLCATVTTSGHYHHSGTMSVDVEHADDSWRSVNPCDADDITDALRSFADWIYSQLESEWEYVNSDEQIDESLRINEYEFTARGDIA